MFYGLTIFYASLILNQFRFSAENIHIFFMTFSSLKCSEMYVTYSIFLDSGFVGRLQSLLVLKSVVISDRYDETSVGSGRLRS